MQNQTRLPARQVPKNWQKVKLNDLGFVGRGKSKHRPRNDSSLYGGKYPFIQTSDVKNANLYIADYSQTYNDEGLAQSKLWDPGALLINLAIFDILTKPDMKLSEKQIKEVKTIAKQLLNKLKQEKIVLDWRSKQQARADVQLTIEKMLDQLPENYNNSIYQQKCNQIYLHIYDSYFGQDKNIYQ